MPAIDYAKLSRDLTDALLVAQSEVLAYAAERTHPHSGICDADAGAANFDAPEVCLPGARSASLARLAAAAGVSFSRASAGYVRVHAPLPLAMQGYLRTAHARAVARVLGARGWQTSVDYRAD
jgi:hypothetical protein